MKLKVGKNFEFILDNFVFDKPEKQGFVLEGGSGCFGKDQKVITDTGVKKISKLSEKDLVLTHNFQTNKDEFKPVNGIHIYTNNKPCFKIRMKSGTEINVTEDHEFLYEGSWVKIKDLLHLWNG